MAFRATLSALEQPFGRRSQSCTCQAGQLRVLPFRLSERSLETFVNGRLAGQFHWVHNLAVDSRGNMYTAEVDTGKRAQKFRRKGSVGCELRDDDDDDDDDD